MGGCLRGRHCLRLDRRRAGLLCPAPHEGAGAKDGVGIPATANHFIPEICRKKRGGGPGRAASSVCPWLGTPASPTEEGRPVLCWPVRSNTAALQKLRLGPR